MCARIKGSILYELSGATNELARGETPKSKKCWLVMSGKNGIFLFHFIAPYKFLNASICCRVKDSIFSPDAYFCTNQQSKRQHHLLIT